MPIDPAGTTPGLPTGASELPKINMRCQQERKDSEGRVVFACDSIEAVEIKLPDAAGFRMYRCVKCSHTRTVQMGGNFSIG